MISDPNLILVLLCTSVLFLAFGGIGLVDSKKWYWKYGGVILIMIGFLIVYGLFTQCPSVAVYQKC